MTEDSFPSQSTKLRLMKPFISTRQSPSSHSVNQISSVDSLQKDKGGVG
jgi:hypothetical protein